MAKDRRRRGRASKEVLKRVAKAAALAAVLYIAVSLPISWVPAEVASQRLFGNFTTFFEIYAILTVASVLASDTVVQPFLEFAKALLPMAVVVSSIDCAVVEVPIQAEGVVIRVSVNLQPVLAIALAISLIGIAKAAFEGVSFLNRHVS